MNKKFTLQFDFEGNIGPIKSTVESLKKSLNGVKLPDNFSTGLEKTFGRLAAEFDNFEAIVKSGFDDLANVSKAEKSFGKIITLVNQLSIQAGQVDGIDPNKLIPKESIDRLKGLEKAWADVRAETDKKSGLDKEIAKQTEEIKKQKKALDDLLNSREELTAKNQALGSQKGGKIKKKASLEKQRGTNYARMTALEQQGGANTAEYQQLKQENKELSATISALGTEIRNLDKAIDSNKVKIAGLDTQIESSNDSYKSMEEHLNNLNNIQITPKGLVELRGEIAKLTNTNIDQVPQDLDELQTVINNLKKEELAKVAQALQKIREEGANVPQAVIPAKESLHNLAETGSEMQRAANEIENLKNQVLDFFSIGNSIQLFKRAITSAMNTVKELDATMTEAAVVTEFDIGDMWDRLPEYSAQAKELGVSINSMYEATTLYYQQGLKTNEAMELGVETMKMAKIAGIDSANATKAMTSALRGFNMELNETSAQRVNDVYSQLAAVTAADTNQIATAMEKTASIASAANMEFETTAAFLSQIIETTQEAPETAGTALKTIIARFAEVKSLREQGLASGEDTEGEIIDVNKIQTALRTVGISMEGFFAGTEGLDSVLMKLAEKWGSLDFETQRYIATMAAGSRQQSRFIAMMSDYKRTAELVSEANNSAGASQRQYEKTLDSLETKLQNLKTAYEEFTMGLANNEILKMGVDLLTNILNTINAITEAISGGSGLNKSIVSLVTVIGGLKVGKSLLGMAGFGGLAGIQGKEAGESAGQQFVSGFISAAKKAKGGEKLAKTKFLGGKIIGGFATKTNNAEEVLKNANFAEGSKGKEIQDQLKSGKINADQAAKAYENLGSKVSDLDGYISSTIPNFKGLASASMLAGSAMGLLATAFEKSGDTEAAETFSTISSALMILGAVFSALGPIVSGVSKVLIANGIAVQAAWWWAVVAVGAIAAVVGVVIALSDSAKELTLEERMEAAAKATEEAKEAANEAKTAYDELLADRSEYGTLQNKLEDLTQGTLEWKQALADSNAQVLELLDTYPELANYLTRGEHGELEISEEGWEIVQERQEQAIKNTQAAYIQSQIDESRLKEEGIIEQLKEPAAENELMGSNRYNDEKTYIEEEFTQEQQLQKIITAYKKYGASFFEGNPEIDSYSQALTDLATEMGVQPQHIYALRDALAKFDQALVQNEITLQAQNEALLTSAASAETNAYEYGDEIIAGFAKGVNANAANDQAAIKNKLYSTNGKYYDENGKQVSLKDTTDFKKMASEAKVNTADLNGDTTHDLEVLYAAMNHIKPGEIAAGLKGNKEALADEIAKMQAAKEAGQDVDKVAEKMRGLNKTTQKEYAAMISGDIGLMDQDIITKYAEVTDDEIKKIASDLGLTTAELAEKMGVAENELTGTLKETAETASAAFGETKEEIVKITGEMPKYLGKASLGGLKKYATLLSQAAALGTEDTIQAGFDAIFNSAEITEAQKSKIISALDTFDWTLEGEGERFLEFLKSIDVDIEGIMSDADNFAKEMKLVNAAFRDFDIDNILDQVKKGLEEAEEIAGQERLTNEQYKKYVANGMIENADEWSWDGKGWVNITSGMDALVNALKANVEATYNLTRQEAQKQVDWYNSTLDAVNKAFEVNITSYVDKDGNYTSVIPNKGEVNKLSRAGAIKKGQATEAEIAQYFGTKQVYQEWLEYYKTGGPENALQVLELTKRFDISSIDISSDQEDYDKYYSVYNELAELARQRERLEKQRNKTLQKGNAQLAKEEREKLIELKQQEYGNQRQVVAGKTREINELLANKNYKSVIKSTGLKYENGVIGFDEEEANNLGVSQRETFDELLSKLEGLVKQQKEAEDGLLDIELELEDLYGQDREDYINAINEIKQTIISEREKEIDILREVNDSINDANSKMIEAMQSAVDKYRQDRDNERTESDIEDKQRRLAYLQQDTSGANAVEIMKLQKEIEQDQEAYADSLIDQKIQELQDQNDKAAEQRERQIQIAEEQLKLMQDDGSIWEEVETLLNGAFDAEGNLIESSDLMSKLKEQAGFDSMSAREQEQWLEQMKTTLTTAKSLSGIVKSDYATGSGGNGAGNVNEDTNETEVKEPEYPKWDSNLPKPSTFTRNLYKGKTGEDVKGLQHALKLLGYYNGPIGGTFGDNTKAALIEFQEANNLDPDGNCGPATRKVFGSIYKYETGGLADFTGPAWLDGSKTRPEYILNADQTQAFFSLVDVLEGLRKNDSARTTQNTGDLNFDIDINVESINDTADLDMISQYVEDKIVASANYRNNNIVGRSR